MQVTLCIRHIWWGRQMGMIHHSFANIVTVCINIYAINIIRYKEKRFFFWYFVHLLVTLHAEFRI